MPFGGFKGNATLVDSILNGTISGTAVGTANGLATLDGTGVLTLSQRFLDALTTGTSNRVGVGSSVAGTDNNVFGAGGFSSMTSGARNTGMGHQILQLITNQNDNSAFGYRALRNNTSSELTALGSYALTSNTTSTKNTGIGFQVLKNNTSSTGGNTAIGHNSMLTNVSGSFNTAIGVDTIRFSSSGSSNIGVGYYALRSNTTPLQNVAIGHGSMQNGTSGQNNVGVGHHSLQNSTVDQQVAIGAFALQFNTTGTNGTAVGYQALQNQTIGNNNSAFGHMAGASITNGDYNVAMGSGALLLATGANNNVAIGVNTLGSVGIFGNNVGVGTNVLASSTSVLPNTAVGHNAMQYNTSGGANTAMGHRAMRANLTGASNSTFGYLAGYANLGSNNTAIGREALASNTASDNTGVGYQSLFSNVSGTGLTALGYLSLTNSTASNNTGVGYRTLTSCIGGDSNTAIGASALDVLTTGTNNVSVGNGSMGNTNASRCVSVGSLSMNIGTGANDVVGLGYLTLSQNTATGSVAIGSYALTANVGGARNTAMGFRTLQTNVTGVDNTGSGFNSLISSTGSRNTANGSLSLGSNGAGNDNTSLGYNSLFANVGGNQNVSIGSGALAATINQSGNIAMGYNSNSIVLSVGDTLAIGRNTRASGANSISLGGDATNPSIVTGTSAIGIGRNVSATSVNGIALGNNAIVTSDNYIQLGESSNSGTSARLRFRSQIIGDESWISAGTFAAAIDASGNILKTAVPVGGSGETNTASNVGVGGVGLFKQKTGVNLEFRNINSGSSKVTVTLDTPNNEVDIDISEANINHNSLLNYVTNQHIDHSAVAINSGTGLTGGGDITTTRTISLDLNGLTTEPTPVLADFIPFYDVSAAAQRKMTITSLQTLIGGEVNTASNVGVGGVGLFKQKTGVDLEFRNINAGSSKISVTLDALNNEVDIDVVEANINHDTLLNYVANQHIDHSAVSISAGTGLTGGGNITTTRTISLDLNSLTTDPTPAVGDFIPTYDISATAQRKITISSLQALIGGEVNTASNVGVGGVGVFKQKTGVNLEFRNINSGSSKVTVSLDALNNEIDIDVVEANINHNTLLNYVANQHIDHSTVSINPGSGISGGGDITTSRTISLDINGLTTEPTPVLADLIPFYDVSAAANRKMTITSLGALIGGGGGEANTASNVGVGGVGLFKQKTGVNLEFRNINSGSSKISVTLDAPNNEVDIDVVEANINHNALLNYVANQHVDHSTVLISAGSGISGGGDITTSRTISLDINGLTTEPTPVLADLIPFYDISAGANRKMTITSLGALIGGGGGEANTASNVGVGGVGLFKQKTGVNLEFRNINSGSSKISVTLDAPNNEVDIDVVEANINHNTLLNYVANQHVDHSTVSISAGTGLTGGGDITTTRTLSLDINSLTTEPAPVLADFIPFYDVSATAQRKLTITSLQTLIGGEANTASNVGVSGVGLFKQKTGVNLEFRNINSGSSKISVTLDAPNNEVDIDVVEANINHNALLNYVANQHVNHSTVSINAGQGLTGGGDITITRTVSLDINGLTLEASPASNDLIPIYDVSATTQRKVTISSLLSTPNVENISGAAAATGVNPSVTIQTTFVSTTSAGADVTGTLADGTVNGMIKNIVATSLLAKYVLTITNGISASGASISTLTFDNTGNTVQLIWNTTAGKWFIVNTGAMVT